ncbi:hypothetical protein N9Y45_03005 [Erythrobacter sp.]|nr:hypothetical protein [Erythrobacter sp.]
MALNASLVLSGDGEGAERALRGVNEELERGQQGAEAYNLAYAKTDASIKKLATAQAQAQRETAETTAAYKAGEISLETYNRELLETKTALGLVEAEHRQTVTALRQANQALGQAPGQTGAARAGYVQLGQQMQDVATMAMMPGVNIGTIIATQGGQVATAVQMMGGRFSGLAGFIAGPWGAAVLVGASLLGTLASEFFSAGDAAGEAESKTYDFADGLDVLKLSAFDAADAMKQLAQDMQTAIAVQGDFLRQNALVAQQSVESLQRRLKSDREELGQLRSSRSGAAATFLPSLFGPSGNDLIRERQLSQRIAGDTAALKPALDALELSEIASAQARVNEQLDAGAAATGRYERAVGELNKRYRAANDDPLDDNSFSAAQYEAEFKRLTERRDAEVEAARESARTTSSRGRRGGGRSAIDREARELQRLTEWGDRAAESIARISERFGEQPTLVVQVNQAARSLDDTIADLERRKPPGFEKLIDEARIAQTVVQEALVRPFTELRQESERRQQIDRLLLAGQEEQAGVLQEIWRIEERLGPLNAEQRAEVEAIVLAEQDHLELLRQAQETQLAYLDATRGVRGELEAIFAGRGDLGNFKQIFRDLKARVMVEQIFGPALQELEDYVTRNTALPDAVNVMASETGRAGKAAGSFADALLGEASRLTGGSAAIPNTSGVEYSSSGELTITVSKDAVREGIEDSNTVMALTPERYFEHMADRMVSPMLDELDRIFGTEFFGKLQGAVSGYLYGSATGGTVGGFLGMGKGFLEDFGIDLFGAETSGFLSNQFEKALGGAQTGSMVAGLGNMLGLKMSGSGSQLGGAVGSFIPIPGGDIIGSIAGGLLGGLFKSKPYGTAVLGADSLTASGKQGDIASGLGGSVQEGLGRIIDALGAELGAYQVSIGTYNDSYRVSTRGQSGKLSGNSKNESRNEREQGLYRFTNEADALAFAISDAIGDGAVKGVSAAVQKALRSSGDVEKGIKEALAVSDLESLLSDAGDAWLQELEDFEQVARERVDLARRYGLDLVKVEELNARERLALTEDLLAEQVGSLQDLINEMTSGSMFEGTAVDRREALLGEIATARGQAQAGEEGAADRLAGLLRQLNEVSSDVYGSTGGFASDRSTILDTARDVISAANQRLEDARAASDPALVQTNAALDENNDQNAMIIGRLEDLNASMRDFIAVGGGSSGFSGRQLMNLARTQ